MRPWNVPKLQLVDLLLSGAFSDLQAENPL